MTAGEDSREEASAGEGRRRRVVRSMRWYKHLYVGEKAKKKRFLIIQNIRKGKLQPKVHVIVPASGGQNILDILPSCVLSQEHYKKQEDLLILGIGADYFESLAVAGEIVHDLYTSTGGFVLDDFLKMNGQR